MFFQIDDQFQVNKKAVGLARAALRGDLNGLAALGIWTMSGSHCQAALTDGVIAFEELVAFTLNADIAQTLADRLVAAELWHGPGHACERCPAVAEGSFLFHDWFALGYDRGHQVRTKRDKSKELKDRTLIASVWARDCTDPSDPNRGACRYCGTELHKKDTRSPDGPQMDHVDPAKAIGARNVVLACGPCNRRKAGKTPEAAGMVLRPAPSHSQAAEHAAAVSPGTPAAETAPSSPTETDVEHQAHRTSAPTSTGTTVEPAPEPQRKSLLAGAGDHAGDGRAGQGRDGSREGNAGKASRTDTNRNRRRRGRRKNKPAPQPPANQHPAPNPHDAGPAPEVTNVPGQFGSPWHGWHGRPSDVTETTCTIHNQEQPCRKCEAANP